MLYTAARLKAHKEPQVQALGEQLLQKMQEIRSLETRAQTLEEEQTLARALLDARDQDRDTTILRLGPFLKAVAPELYEQILPKRPSEIARAAYAQETKDLEAVTTRLEALPADHLVRQTYLQELKEDISAFQQASGAKDVVEQALVAFRLQSLQGKIAADEYRYQLQAEAAKLLPKADVDDLFSTLKRSDS
jgi:hypothetical protein